MGSSQSTESPATTATRQSPDQRIVGNSGGSAVGDLSSRKTGAMPSSSRQNHTDSSRMLFMSVGDSRRGELSSRGGGGGVKMSSRREGRDSDDSPSSHHHTLTQPPPPQQRSTAPPTTQSQHHSPHLIHPSHSHHPQNRSHPHRQRNRHPLPPPDNLPPTLDYELGVPSLMFSRSQPTVAGNPTNREPELELVIPRASSRSRRYYDGGSAGDVELDLSMASLSRRLRAVGLFTEENGGGSSSSSGGLSGSGGGLSSSSSSRRHHRPRRHHSHSSHGSSSGGSRSRRYLANSATPSSVVLVRGLSARSMTCPLCSKEFSPTDLEEHLLTCMTKPRVRYNVDTLQQDSGECSICLEDMLTGDQIARLPCLCIYHINCLQQWYKVNPTCPAHPDSTL